MTVKNAGFEDVDPGHPGGAEHWSIGGEGRIEPGLFVQVDGISDPFDNFVWYDDQLASAVQLVEHGLMSDGERPEDFESGWGSDSPPAGIQSLEIGLFAGAVESEGFESGWGNDSPDAGVGSLEPGEFTGSDEIDGFEEGWDNDSPTAGVPSLEDGETGTPSGTEPVETFEALAAPVGCFVDPVTDTVLTVDPHGLVVDDVVVFENVGGELPEGIQPGVAYYVEDVPTTDTFTIKPQPAATALDIEDFGTGQHAYTLDRTRYWITRGLL
jgi:hypothetical protein